jgi:hypothetical protein
MQNENIPEYIVINYKNKSRIHNKNQICSYSGEKTDNKEVILTKYAIDYVRKMGYLVTNFKIT